MGSVDHGFHPSDMLSGPFQILRLELKVQLTKQGTFTRANLERKVDLVEDLNIQMYLF